jgi:UDP-N-acetylglucosamine--N-acetylmuramyl-(pentapeptide) pyrophosphoryl-undecaprenol N-acetylglucosamine transferase
MSAPVRTILIMAGGTGGHVYPGLAVARALIARGWQAVWLGTRAGLEARVVPREGIPMEWLSFAGVRGKGLWSRLLLPAKLLLAFAQAARAIFRHRPHVVLGMGGYVAFPGGMMASLFKRPLVIHEQNSVAGLANRVLACLADRVLTGFPQAFLGPRDAPIPCRRVATHWVGNPVRADILALPAPAARYGGREGRLRLLVVGGSLGAKVLNEVVPQALACMVPDTRPRVVHQAGLSHIEDLRARYREAGVQAEILPFIEDMAARFGEADVVLCRAGAATVAELAAAGVASILVPYPYAVDDHQTGNAHFLADAGAAILLPQSELTAKRLSTLLSGLTREGLAAMAEKARALAKPDATEAVVAACVELAA